MAIEITKEQLSAAVADSTSVSGVLRLLGLGEGSRARVKRLIVRHGLDTSHFTWTHQHHTREQLEAAVAASTSIAGVMRYLGIKWAGGSHAHLSRRLKQLEIDTTHFTGQVWNKGKRTFRRRPQALLVKLPKGSRRTRARTLRRAMLVAGVPYCCAVCGSPPAWLGTPLILEIDHINGDPLDNRLENLRFLCPNCHSQTSTYCGRNKRDDRSDAA